MPGVRQPPLDNCVRRISDRYRNCTSGAGREWTVFPYYDGRAGGPNLDYRQLMGHNQISRVFRHLVKLLIRVVKKPDMPHS